MLKNKTVIEVKINDRIYSLECSPDSPLGELHDALSQMKGYVIAKMVDLEKKVVENKDDPNQPPEVVD